MVGAPDTVWVHQLGQLRCVVRWLLPLGDMAAMIAVIWGLVTGGGVYDFVV